jgi:hypothetical protein
MHDGSNPHTQYFSSLSSGQLGTMVGQNDSHPDPHGSPGIWTGVDTQVVSQLNNGSQSLINPSRFDAMVDHEKVSGSTFNVQLSSRSDSGWSTHYSSHAGADSVEEKQKARRNPEGMGSENRKYRTASEDLNFGDGLQRNSSEHGYKQIEVKAS